ncbi:MAG: hypothetical protein A2173_01640 [Planctomycetes bacterium RBG_13_44_8b]|nr:MAG: hypothetical protein A2173_01640 [Planctomycetes bacterium RBG_13_44_8b]
MSAERVVAVVFLSVVLSVLAGCGPTTGGPTAQMKLNLSPQGETTYKVVTEFGKDYSFIQPSINKTKGRHTSTRVEVVFAQEIEGIDQEGIATAIITIKEIRFLFMDVEGQKAFFDSTAESSKSDPVCAAIGQSYKIQITPDGQVKSIDAESARGVIKEEGLPKKFVNRLFSNKEIIKRHQVLALMDAGQTLYKKGDKWSVVAASPEGMLSAKSFEKVYTVTDIKMQDGEKIAIVDMSAAPSSKRAADMAEDDPKANFFAKMFEETSDYNGKMVLNLSTGEIDSYREFLKAEWLVIEPSAQQKGDKGPDQLTMSLSDLYSIEKVSSGN